MNKSTLSTLLGAIVAIANAWYNVDWTNFAFDAPHLMPLVVSAAIALGGYMTKIEVPKRKSNKYENK